MNKKTVGILIFLYIFTLLRVLFNLKLGFGLVDEGEYLHIGNRILEGQLPYRDFFAYLPPLYLYWPVLSFKIFGVHPYSLRLLNDLFFAFLPPIIYLLAVRISRPRYAFVSVIALTFMEVDMGRIFYDSFIFGGLLSYLYFIHSTRKIYGFLGGFLIGVGALFRFDTAIAIFLGTLVGYSLVQVLNKSFSLTKFMISQALLVIGVLFPIALMVLWLIKFSLLNTFLHNLLITSVLITKENRLPFPGLFEIIPSELSPRVLFNSYQAWYAYLLVAVATLTVIYLFRNWKIIRKSSPELIIYVSAAIFMAPYMFGRTDLGHLVKGGLTFFIIAPFLLTKFNHLFFKMIGLLAYSIIIIVGVGQLVWFQKFNDKQITLNTGKVFLNSIWPVGSTLISAGTIEESVDFIDKNSSKEDSILVLPYMAGIYFLADHPADSPVGNLFYGYIKNEKEYIAILQQKMPAVVIYDPVNGPPNTRKTLKSYYPDIDSFIMGNYQVIKRTAEGWLFMTRKNYD